MEDKIRKYILSKSDELGLSDGKVNVERIKNAHSNLVFRISTKHESFVLKIITDSFVSEEKIAQKEVELLKVFKSLSPKVVLFDSFDGHPAILMNELQGSTLSKVKISDEDLSMAAIVLAKIHSTSITPKTERILCRKYLKVPEENLDESLNWLRGLGKKDPIIKKTMKIYQKFHKFYLQSIPKTKNVLCHGEFSLGNIIKDGKSLKVIDWETALIGDPAYDIAWLFVTSEYGSLLTNDQERFFVKEYLKVKPDSDLERRIRVYCKLCNLEALFWEIRESYLGSNIARELGADKDFVSKKILKNLDILENVDLDNESRMLFVS